MRVAFAGATRNPGRNLARAMALGGDQLALIGGDPEELAHSAHDLEIRARYRVPLQLPLGADGIAVALATARRSLGGLDTIILHIDEIYPDRPPGARTEVAPPAPLHPGVPGLIDLAAADLLVGAGGCVCVLHAHPDDDPEPRPPNSAPLLKARAAALGALVLELDRRYRGLGVRVIQRTSRDIVGRPAPAQARTAWATAAGRRRAARVRRSIHAVASRAWSQRLDIPRARFRPPRGTLHTEFAEIRISSALGVSPVGTDTLLLARHAAGIEVKTVLEMGVGSGLVGVYLARLGRRVLGADLNGRAASCTHANGALNRVAVTVVESDLFSNVTGRFDLIVFNPPAGSSRSPWINRQIELVKSLLPKNSSTLHRLASRWILASRAALLAQFLAEAPVHLTADGQILLLLYPSEMPLAADYDCETLAGEANGLHPVRARPRTTP